MPGRRGVGQAGVDIPHPRSRVAVLQPTQLNSPPQIVAEPKLFRPLRFYRSDPLHNRVNG